MWFSKKRVYLDTAAAAPVTKASAKAFAEAFAYFGNPSAPHTEGKIARDLLERSRAMIAKIIGVKKEAIIFTGTATEANGLALLGHVHALYASRKPENIHILYSPVSHSSVIETIQTLKAEGCEVEELVLADNAIDLAALKSQIRKETALISCDLICGETGTQFKTRDIRRVIDAGMAAPYPLFHVDASQGPFVESIELQHIGADLLTFDAQKIGGVRGVGVLVAARNIPLAPLYGGGGQERGVRSGTPAPALAYACAVALTEADRKRDSFIQKANNLKKVLLTELENATLPYMVVNGGNVVAPHILNISFPGYDTDYLAALLDEYGFAVSTKSACETNAVGSRVVLALTGDPERAASTLRISFNRETRKNEVQHFVQALKKAFSVIGRI